MVPRNYIASGIAAKLRFLTRNLLPVSVAIYLLARLAITCCVVRAGFLSIREVGYGDSYVLYDVLNFEKTGIIYRDLAFPPYLPAQYSPLIYITYSLSRFIQSSNIFLGCRVIALLMFLGCLWMTICIVQKLIPLRYAWLWGLLIMASVRSLDTWILVIRGDFLGIFFALAAIRLLYSRIPFGPFLAGLCAGMAIQVKLTLLAAAFSGFLWLLTKRRWKDTAIFACGVTLTTVGLFFLYWLREPGMIRQMTVVMPGIKDLPGGVLLLVHALGEITVLLSLPALALIISRLRSRFRQPTRAWLNWTLSRNTRKTGTPRPPVSAGSSSVWRLGLMPFALSRNTRKTGTPRPPVTAGSSPVWRLGLMPFALLLLYVLSSAGLAFVAAIQAGANINYYFEALLALTPFSVLGTFYLFSWSKQRFALAVFLGFLFLFRFPVSDFKTFSERPKSDYSADVVIKDNRQFMNLERALQGERIFSIDPRAALIDPHPALLEPYLVTYLRRIGHFNADPLIRRISASEFDVFIALPPGEPAYRGIRKFDGADLASAVYDVYEPYCQLSNDIIELPRNRTNMELKRKLQAAGCVTQIDSVMYQAPSKY
jgi:hypothetical protein